MRYNMKKKNLIWILFLFVFNNFLNAEKSFYDIKELSNFFWEVKSDSATVYLLGSVHIAKEDIYPLPPIIEKSFKESDTLVIEVDINNVNPMIILQKAMYQDDRTLESELSNETYKKLIMLLEKYNIPELAYNKMKPWMAVTTVLLLQLKENGFEQSLGIERYFLEKAQGIKEILQLETAEEQLNLLDSGLSGLQEEFVKYSFLEQENMMSQVDTMMDFWKNGNYKGMEHFALEIPQEIPHAEFILEKLYKERNIKMTEKITHFLSSNKIYFVVVGAAHLIGDEGIISLLKNN
jgi:uncharacterized protein